MSLPYGVENTVADAMERIPELLEEGALPCGILGRQMQADGWRGTWGDVGTAIHLLERRGVIVRTNEGVGYGTDAEYALADLDLGAR